MGILTQGAKVGALTGNRVLNRDGLLMATLAGGEVYFRGDAVRGLLTTGY